MFTMNEFKMLGRYSCVAPILSCYPTVARSVGVRYGLNGMAGSTCFGVEVGGFGTGGGVRARSEGRRKERAGGHEQKKKEGKAVWRIYTVMSRVEMRCGCSGK